MTTTHTDQLYPLQPQPPAGVGSVEGGWEGIGHAIIWHPKDAENPLWRHFATEEEIKADQMMAVAPRECDAETYVASVHIDGVRWWLVTPSGTKQEIFDRAVAEGATHVRFDEEPGCPAHFTFFRYTEAGTVESRWATEYQDSRWGLELWSPWEALHEDTSCIPDWADPVEQAAVLLS